MGRKEWRELETYAFRSETYAFRTVLRAIGNSEPLRQRVLDAHSAKLREVRERGF